MEGTKYLVRYLSIESKVCLLPVVDETQSLGTDDRPDPAPWYYITVQECISCQGCLSGNITDMIPVKKHSNAKH